MEPERPKYFDGQFLDAQDLNAEQEYFRKKGQRHNRYCHGSGIVWGLGVTINGKPGGKGTSVHVEPGFAIDCQGNEIEIEECHVIPVASLPKRAPLFVVVRYRERETKPVPAPGNQGEVLRMTRIVETFTLSLVNRNPLAGHHPPPGRQTCGRPHPIPIARLTKAKGAWVVDARFAVPRAKCK